MNVLAFLLALGLVGAVVGAVVGVGSAVVAVALARVADTVAAVTGRRLGPATRAELWLAAGLVPALAPVVVVVAGGGAALVALAGVTDHHCLAHLHHLHLCPEHLGAGGHTIMPWQALVGGAAWALALTRLAMQGRRWWSTRRLVRALTAHRAAGPHGADVVVVDGPPTLLHAAGDVVIASRSLLSALSPATLDAVLAHERAHLCRRDPRALDALGWAAAVVPPFMGAAVRRRFIAAAEDAADDAAALQAGAVVVAGALVEVARLRLPSSLDAVLPAGGVDVERRVERLLVDSPRRPARPGIVLTACVVVAGAGLVAGDGVHHAAETLLAVVSPGSTTTP